MTPIEIAERVGTILRQFVDDSPIVDAKIGYKLMPIYEIADLSVCQVPCLPARHFARTGSRGRPEREIVVVVGPQWKCEMADGKHDEEQILRFIEFIEWIETTLRTESPNYGLQWVESESQPIYDLEQLRENNMLTSLVNVTYRSLR